MPIVGLVIDLGGLVALSLAGYVMTRVGIPKLPIARSASKNLVAVRANAESRPWLWLSAHIDSKSQTIPMLLRVASAVAFTTMSIGATICIIVIAAFSNLRQLAGGEVLSFASAATVFGWLAVVSAIPIVLCFIQDRSRGALDNATGVASVLLAADQIDPSVNIGIVITSAEELGLAGARAFALTERDGEVAINCDTIDENGAFLCMASGARIHRLDEAIDRAASRLGIPTSGMPGRGRRASLRLSRMLPGILADNMAFTDAGWESFTLSRGNIGTLSLVHTSNDVSDRMKGTGVAKAAEFIAAIVQEIG